MVCECVYIVWSSVELPTRYLYANIISKQVFASYIASMKLRIHGKGVQSHWWYNYTAYKWHTKNCDAA